MVCGIINCCKSEAPCMPCPLLVQATHPGFMEHHMYPCFHQDAACLMVTHSPGCLLLKSLTQLPESPRPSPPHLPILLTSGPIYTHLPGYCSSLTIKASSAHRRVRPNHQCQPYPKPLPLHSDLSNTCRG